tara:strand:+ start:154 stop:894 length:741 start_codon:yes stop_codon:yes gene_type:complete
MNVIILAAGQGSRMGKLTSDIPKPLLPIGNTNVISRIISQLLFRGVERITLVVGFKAELFYEKLNSLFPDKLDFVFNQNFKQDVNIYSVYLALKEKNYPHFIIFESDCIYTDECMDMIVSSYKDVNSHWYSIGNFKQNQTGGILRSDKFGLINDLKIVSCYEDSYNSYKKLIGILHVHEGNSELYFDLIKKEVKKNINQYYLQPWIDNLKNLPSYEVALGNSAEAFNTENEYNNSKFFYEEKLKNE